MKAWMRMRAHQRHVRVGIATNLSVSGQPQVAAIYSPDRKFKVWMDHREIFIALINDQQTLYAPGHCIET